VSVCGVIDIIDQILPGHNTLWDASVSFRRQRRDDRTEDESGANGGKCNSSAAYRGTGSRVVIVEKRRGRWHAFSRVQGRKKAAIDEHSQRGVRRPTRARRVTPETRWVLPRPRGLTGERGGGLGRRRSA